MSGPYDDYLTIDGRQIDRHPVSKGIAQYVKTGTVLASPAPSDGLVHTPEGSMAFSKGDYIVTDDPPTHCWPVRKAVFEATYAPVEVLQDDEIITR